VADGVVDHVLDHLGKQRRTADDTCFAAFVSVDGDIHQRDRAGAALDRRGDEVGERERGLIGGRAVLDVGESEEAFQQPVDVVELTAEPVGEGDDLWGYRPWLGHRHIE
jgi:hypothetical protein